MSKTKHHKLRKPKQRRKAGFLPITAANDPDYRRIEGTVVDETPKAIQLRCDSFNPDFPNGYLLWLAKSVIQRFPDGPRSMAGEVVHVPAWLYRRLLPAQSPLRFPPKPDILELTTDQKRRLP